MRDLTGLVEKLKRLAKDREGTPEGDLANEMIQKLLDKYPDLQATDDESEEIEYRIRMSHDYEFLLWQLACKAHKIEITKLKSDPPYEVHCLSNEVDIIIAKSEWEFAVRNFSEIAKQVIRGIVNKLWPLVCSAAPADTEEPPFSQFARDTMNQVKTLKKQIKETN
jgi:hypothetical protein